MHIFLYRCENEPFVLGEKNRFFQTHLLTQDLIDFKSSTFCQMNHQIALLEALKSASTVRAIAITLLVKLLLCKKNNPLNCNGQISYKKTAQQENNPNMSTLKIYILYRFTMTSFPLKF